MKPSLQKLQKFFKLESERGYDDRAVVGGLVRIIDTWESDARADSLPEELIEAVKVRLRDYNRLSPNSRQESLQGLWQRIQRILEDEGQPEHRKEISESIEIPAEEPTPHEQDQPPSVTAPERKSSEEIEPRVKEEIAEVQVVEEPAALKSPVTVLSGVGPRHGETLKRLGMTTLGDMLYYFPRRYDDYSKLKSIRRLIYGEEVTVIGTIQNVSKRSLRNRRMTITEAVLSDGTDSLQLTWFNQPWIEQRLRKGTQIVVSGKVDQYLGRKVMNNPETEPLEQQNLHTNRIIPIYPLTAKITQRWLRRLMHQVVSYWAPRVTDALPISLRRAADLLELPDALMQIHFPDSWEQLEAARYRLALEEVFLLQLGLLQQKRKWQNRNARVFNVSDQWLTEQLSHLPFELTSAQKHAIKDLLSDLSSGQPMNRLLEGDVGSGKTVVAALAIALVVHHAAQAALMAPTSILAEQHYRSLRKLLVESAGVVSEKEIKLMIGATPESEKRAIRQGLENGAIKVLIGTHALIEEPVTFSDLQLAIVDEQHRFGVEQRADLRNKGDNPHLLVMTATPIPRSLALCVYGDLDLTIMDEMPPGRQEISTHILTPTIRERAYSLIRKEVERGHQAFIIYPLVEEGDNANANGKAAVEEQQRLQNEIFPDFKLGLLHGRLKPDEKDLVMTRFRDGEDQILVSTSVVEVGVDIPNATVMLIEGANRFGLAQLHQFRGRVGRGQDRAYCLLIPDTHDALENERLKAMGKTNDGFVLANIDLELRGPGDFLGTRQSGFAELRMANLADVHLIEKARSAAKTIFEHDPELSIPEHKHLSIALKRFWKEGGDIS
jgi:ATP-dependent DNA helicase RecG